MISYISLHQTLHPWAVKLGLGPVNVVKCGIDISGLVHLCVVKHTS